MKRLIRKALDPGTPDLETNVVSPPNMVNMKKLDQLSEADVRHDRCPICKYDPLLKDQGFKYCPACMLVYKLLDGNGYIVDQEVNVDEVGMDVHQNRTIEDETIEDERKERSNLLKDTLYPTPNPP